MGSFLGFIVGSFVGSLEKIVGSQKHRHSLRCGGVFHISYEYHCLTIYITRSSLIFQIVSCFSMIKLSFTFFRKAPILILEPIVGTGHGGVTSRERESVEVLPIIGFSYILVVRSIPLLVKVKRRNPAPYFYKEPFAPNTMAVSSICFRKADAALSLSPVKIASKIC